MTPVPDNHLDDNLSARSLVERIIEDFLDSWVMHAYLLPTNSLRDDFKNESIIKLQNMIQAISSIDFSRFNLTEWDVLDSIEEEKSND